MAPNTPRSCGFVPDNLSLVNVQVLCPGAVIAKFVTQAITISFLSQCLKLIVLCQFNGLILYGFYESEWLQYWYHILLSLIWRKVVAVEQELCANQTHDSSCLLDVHFKYSEVFAQVQHIVYRFAIYDYLRGDELYANSNKTYNKFPAFN